MNNVVWEYDLYRIHIYMFRLHSSLNKFSKVFDKPLHFTSLSRLSEKTKFVDMFELSLMQLIGNRLDALCHLVEVQGTCLYIL